VSYALDSKTTIDRTRKNDSVNGAITVAKGIMRIAYTQRAATTYTIKAPEKEARTVILEQQRRHGYDLVTPDPKKVEVSDNRYRIRVRLKPGEKKVVPVVLEHKGFRSIMLSGMSSGQFAAYATTQGDLDRGARKAFAALAKKRQEIDVFDRKIAGVDRRRQAIIRDQSRVRQNLASLPGRSQVKDKYLAKLNAQEDDLERLDAEKEKLSAARQHRRAELADMIADIKI